MDTATNLNDNVADGEAGGQTPRIIHGPEEHAWVAVGEHTYNGSTWMQLFTVYYCPGCGKYGERVRAYYDYRRRKPADVALMRKQEEEAFNKLMEECNADYRTCAVRQAARAEEYRQLAEAARTAAQERANRGR